MSDIETLRAELHAEIDRRIDAATKQAADVEPPMPLDPTTLHNWLSRPICTAAGDAAREIVYLRAELARLREGLKVRESDITSLELESWGDGNDFEYSLESMRGYIRSQCRMMAREIQRHRALVTK